MTENLKALIEIVDQTTHDNIIQLEEKLNTLSQEIKAKLTDPDGAAEMTADYKVHLEKLLNETEDALDNINTMMEIALPENEHFDSLSGTELDEFNQFVKEGLNELSQLTEKF